MKVLLDLRPEHLEKLKYAISHLKASGITSNRSEVIRIAIEMLDVKSAADHVAAEARAKLAKLELESP